MLRFPNPGSDIDSFIRIYQEIYEALREQVPFELDDITRILVDRNLATSSGYTGDEALRRSYNKDRSRDRFYNQSKSYSELYKILGWLHPSQGSALTFHFTYLGAHVVAAKRDPAALFKESILGIAYPNAILGVKGKYILRPFVAILRTMEALDGLLSRDEMIIGPLSLEDDTSTSKFNAMITELKSVRNGGSDSLSAKLEAASRARSISTNTMRNYTRFPIAVMKWSDWAQSQRREDYYDQSTSFLVLTNEGRQTLQRVKTYSDIRGANIRLANDDTRTAIVRIGFYQMLERAGFEIDAYRGQLVSDQKYATSFLNNTSKPLLFSPFQDIDPEYTSKIFPVVSGVKVGEVSRLDISSTALLLPQFSPEVSLSAMPTSIHKQEDRVLTALFTDASVRFKGNLYQVANYMAEKFMKSNKDEFYPLIARLFRALGYNCEHSRHGVNYQRWDALITDPTYSIPIEIKSPGEEVFISVKAVRQALENKIVLLSRKHSPTHPTTTSLVVGYKCPNDRSDVASLIADIYKAFGIVIGVIDLSSLLYLVAATVLEGKEHNADELRNLYGIIQVANA
jgi:hypothetical protein